MWNFINNKTPGKIVPSFWSYREYNGKQIPQWMWFCNSDMQHTWHVDKHVQIVPQLPRLWLVEDGTKLTQNEANMLHEIGITLRRNNGDRSSHHESDFLASLDPPYSKRTKIWKHGISKEAEKKIAKALELN